jgi:hypothetical protein
LLRAGEVLPIWGDAKGGRGIWVVVYDIKSESLTVHHGMLQYQCLEHLDLATQTSSPDTDKIRTFYTPCFTRNIFCDIACF